MFQQPSSFSGGGQSTPSGSSFLEKARTWASSRPMFSLVAAIVLGSVVMSVPMSSALTGLANLQKQSADAAGYILQVDPTPVKVCSGKTAQVSISWAVPDVGSYEVRRGSASGAVVGRATGGGKVSISDAMNGENFYLLPGYSLLNKTSLRVSATVLASTSVVFTTQGCGSDTTPPVTTSCASTGILGVSATASRSLSTNPPSLAVDGRVDTLWNSGAFPAQYIQLDLGNAYNVTGLCVNAAQLPAGVTYHDISAGSSVSTLRTVAVLNEALPIDQWKYVPVVANGARFVKINTTSSPSWVAWNEIKVFGTLSSGDVPPVSGVCPAASVVANYAGLSIGDKMSFDSSMPQDFNTLSFTSSNIAVVSVSGTGGVVTGYGTASISGQGFSRIAGQFCPLAPTTITITPTAPGPSVGSLSPTGSHTITYCTNNGTSQGAPVQLSASVTSGFGKIVVTGNSVGLEPYPMQFGPGQPWTKNVEAGNIVIANGQTTGSITISLVDFYSDSHVLGSVTIVRENKNCTPTPPTGTITPGVNYVSLNNCQNRPASVTLTANISAGLGKIVVGSTQNTGYNLPLIWVWAGTPATFTVSASGMADFSGVTFNIEDENGNLVQGAGAVVYRDDRSCGTATAPQGSITFAAEGLLQGHELYLCPGTQTSVSASATANVASTLSIGTREATLGNVGTNSWRGGMSFRVDAPGNGVISSYAAVLRPAVFGNDLASEVVSVHGSNSKCAAQTGTGSVAVQLPNTSGDYAACAPEGLNTYVNVVINSYNTSPRGGHNLVFSADGAVLQPEQSHQYTDAVLIRPNDSILKTYNLTDNGTVVAYDSITIRGIACGTLTASPSEVIVYFGTVGYTFLTATNNSDSDMTLSGDGVNQTVAAHSTAQVQKQVIVGDAPRVYTLSQGINMIAQATVTVRNNTSK